MEEESGRARRNSGKSGRLESTSTEFHGKICYEISQQRQRMLKASLPGKRTYFCSTSSSTSLFSNFTIPERVTQSNPRCRFTFTFPFTPACITNFFLGWCFLRYQIPHKPLTYNASFLSSSPSANSTPINNTNSNGKDRDREPKVATVPLRACCLDCFHITEECSRTGDQWEERFSKGARRRRGSSVSSSSGASVTSEEGGDQEAAMYSPMASYQPLRLAAGNASNAVDATKSNPGSNPNSAASTSAVMLDGGDEDDEPDMEVSTFVTEVTVDEVDSIRKRKGKFKNWEPSLRSEGEPTM
ncbi:hypothetical protein MPER_03057 [Moniliophthora perniciosa FA553]|nr:hypothetical protein MPER_03057 [Moniliophthora perniciosa FA553]